MCRLRFKFLIDYDEVTNADSIYMYYTFDEKKSFNIIILFTKLSLWVDKLEV